MPWISRALLAVALLLPGSLGQNPATVPPPPPPQVLSVRDFGARGDGITKDTDAIQRCVNALRPGGTVRFPPGKYLIETDKGIQLKDNMRLDLGSAILVGPNVRGVRCRLLHIQGRRNIVITGGTLIGTHFGDPEWAVGIFAADAQDILIENIWVRDFHLDGVLLTGDLGCQRITVRAMVGVNNRRTGLAIVHATDVAVEDSTFNNTRGQSPEAGVNLEPNKGWSVRNVRVRRCWFRANGGAAFYAHRGLGDAVAGVSVSESVFEDNGYGIVASQVDGVSIVANRVRRHVATNASGIAVGGSARASVLGNWLEGNFRGILTSGSPGADIRQNTVVGTAPTLMGQGRDGISCLGANVPALGCAVIANTVRLSGGSGIVVRLVNQARVVDNTIEDSGNRAILMFTTVSSEVRGNKIWRAALEPPPGRYDAIELVVASHNNFVLMNTLHLSAGLRKPIGVGPDCLTNQLVNNTVLPD